MKARDVKGLDPAGPLADNAQRIVLARLDELHGFAPAVLDPRHVDELHDMRIAAKRLRYVLELTEHLFGPYAAAAARRARELQDLLGEIHDCDETLPRVRRLMTAEQHEVARRLRERAKPRADDLDPALAADAPQADAWRGLHAFAAWLEARRSLLYDRFLELWTELGRAGFRARLEYASAERSPSPEPEPEPEPEAELSEGLVPTQEPEPEPETALEPGAPTPAYATRTDP